MFGMIAEATIVVSGLVFLITVNLWALAGWLVVGTLYVLLTLASVWNMDGLDCEDEPEVRALAHWSWISPLLAAAVGVVSAVTALVEKNSAASDPVNLLTTVAASVGVILSWMLLQVGFAQIYLVLALTGDRDGLQFPGATRLTVLNFLYFSFTVGTSFATSDVNVTSVKMRRVVLIHSVFAFFYNAIVVAVAFQVLQGAVVS